ncbi:MAG: TerB N-terminal domain-containing protein [Clostridia bacterium]|nr:TerB N-terminal domain-containing protein [Clostridia bacterium]
MELADLVSYALQKYGIEECYLLNEGPGVTALADASNGTWLALYQRDEDSTGAKECCDIYCGRQAFREMDKTWLSTPFFMTGEGWTGIAFSGKTERNTVFKLFDLAVTRARQEADSGKVQDRQIQKSKISGDSNKTADSEYDRIAGMLETGAEISESAERFCLQAKSMEHFETDKGMGFCPVPPDQTGKDTYSDLTVYDLLEYFTWRTHIRRHEYLPAPAVFACLYVNELLNGIGADGEMDAFDRLIEFDRQCIEPEIIRLDQQSRIKRWIVDYGIIHNLPAEWIQAYVDPIRKERDRNLEVLMHPDDAGDEAVYRALRYFDERRETIWSVEKSAERAKHLYAEVWRKCRKESRIDEKPVFEALFGTPAPYEKVLLSGAVWCRQVMPDREYVLNACRSYRCQNGEWTEIRYDGLNFRKKEYLAMLDEIEKQLCRYFAIPKRAPQREGALWVESLIKTVLRGAHTTASKPVTQRFTTQLVRPVKPPENVVVIRTDAEPASGRRTMHHAGQGRDPAKKSDAAGAERRNVSPGQPESILHEPEMNREKMTAFLLIKKMRRMISAAPDAQTSQKETFYRQAKFMEQFETDEKDRETFGCANPSGIVYSDFSDTELYDYFVWRTHIRHRHYLKAPGAFQWVYMSELINGIGASTPEDAFMKMDAFRQSGSFSMSLCTRADIWMSGYAVMHGLKSETVRRYHNEAAPNAEKKALILMSPQAYSDENVAKGIEENCTVGFWSMKNHPAKEKEAVHLIAECWRRICREDKTGDGHILSALFERTEQKDVDMLPGVVYAGAVPVYEGEYEVNEGLSYRFESGSWTASCIRINVPVCSQLLDEIVLETERQMEKDAGHLAGNDDERRTEHVVSAVLKIFPRLTSNVIQKDKTGNMPKLQKAAPYGDGQTAAGFRDSPKPDADETRRDLCHIDVAKLERIRENADEIAGRLLTDAEQETGLSESADSPTEEKPKEPVSDEAVSFGLSPENRNLLMTLLRGESVAELIRAGRRMASVAADEINDALYDEIGDMVVEADGDNLVLVEDYRGMLMDRLLSCVHTETSKTPGREIGG